MQNQITTLAQAEQHLRSTGIVRQTQNFKEVVEGKQLLDVCGFGYTDKNWGDKITRQIEKHNFIEGVDFKKINPPSMGEKSKGRPKTVYVFTLNAANHVLLAAMTAQGKQARDLAIKAVERPVSLATACSELPDLNDPIAVLKAFTASLEHKQNLEHQLEIAAPKVEFYDYVAECDELFSMKEAADILGFGRNTFFQILREDQILTTGNIPYRQYIERGYFEVKVSTAFGAISVTKVTTKGLQWLQKHYSK
ncbi:phage antirepressor KilAC domain-containing protein [Photobacterium swingsii]